MGQRHIQMGQRHSLMGQRSFTFGATNWETLFTTHFGKEPADRDKGTESQAEVHFKHEAQIEFTDRTFVHNTHTNTHRLCTVDCHQFFCWMKKFVDL